MARRLFGTDGIRAEANCEPMTAETALKVAQGAAQVFRRGDHRHSVVIGKDTRLSGYMLETAMTAGFVSMGMDVVLTGPLPTPAIATLTKSMRADVGVVISASHNPYADNGIKLFGHDGFKLSDALEDEIEALVNNERARRPAAPAQIGQARRMEDAGGRYIEYAKATFPKELTLEGLTIVVDCAHGATYKVAPRVLYELGATVIPLGVQPNGQNINDRCGATDAAAMCEAVVAHGADLGLALDGDGDRVILADERGQLLDGDQVMAALAKSWQQAGRLRGDGVVATVMSNLGLERFLRTLGLALYRTQVGDRFVVERMRSQGFNVGGEQSGHIVLGDYATTGDGLIAALQVLAIMGEREMPASALGGVFEPVPQVLRNVRYNMSLDGSPLEVPAVARTIKAAESRLADQGRLLIRVSGTEPVIRVMAEGDDRPLVEGLVDDLCQDIQASLSDQVA